MNSKTIPSEQLQIENVSTCLIHSEIVLLHCCSEFWPAFNKEKAEA